MNRTPITVRSGRNLPLSAAALLAGAMIAASAAHAQVPVDEQGYPLTPIESSGDSTYTYDEDDIQYEEAVSDSALPPLTPVELGSLIGPVALYPDDLLAIVLPASTYPLQIVQAARFLEQYETDNSITPNESWDESVTALLNYPEVVHMLNDDIDWTWKLGEAVVRQQQDVVAAVESFRDRAYAAGNLRSDERQNVVESEGIIEIIPIEEDIIYVPYYEPQHVLVSQVTPVYHYYPRAYPVYYYPYPYGHSFTRQRFWGVTTAFRMGWRSDYVHVQHASYWGHPYYGRDYYAHNYRSTNINIYNSTYVRRGNRSQSQRYSNGDYWRPRTNSHVRPGTYRTSTRSYRESDQRSGASQNRVVAKRDNDIRFRSRGNSSRTKSIRSAQPVRTNQVATTRTTRPTTTQRTRKTLPAPTRQTRQAQRRTEPGSRTETRAATGTRRAASTQPSRKAAAAPARQSTKRTTTASRPAAKVTRGETRNSGQGSGRQNSRRTRRQ